MLLPHDVFLQTHGYLAKSLPDEPNLGEKTEEAQADDVEPKKKMSDDGSGDSEEPDDKDEEKSLSSKKRKVIFCIEHSPV